jgi:class III poly(R)-hydroxyalkanoic acid synthase PhaE subunit
VSQAANNWIDAWLETQRGWLGRWQSVAVEQRADALRHSMDTLREHLNPASMSPQAINVVHSFQALLQSCMTNASEMAGMLNAEGEQPLNLWQQMLQAFPLGPAREQQTDWQEYLKAQAEYQLRLQVVLQAFGKVFTQSLEAVPAQAAARAAQGNPITGFRELYELWIDCGEQAFAELAHDEPFIAAQAASANALSHLQIAQNALLEHWLKSHDLPTRSELNSMHLHLRSLTARIAALEQQLANKPVAKARRSRPSKE